MKRAALVLVLLGAAPVTPLVAQATEPLAQPLTDRFPVGETLVYEVKFGIARLGSGMMHVAGIDTVRGVPALHVVFRLQSSTFLYRLDDRYDSWIGINDFASRRFVQEQHEGDRDWTSRYEIFPDSGYYVQEGVDTIAPSSPNPLDDAAFFYFVRTVDLHVGDRYEYQNYFRPDRNPVVLEVLGRDTLDLPAGRFPTFVVKPTIQGRGIFAEAREPRMWLSDDDRRFIVQLKIKFSFMTLTMRLKEVADAPPEELAIN